MIFSKWHGLSLPTRIKIATAFGIAKVGPTHVADNQIQSDGYKFQDIERAITVESLQRYLSSNETDFGTLFLQLVDRMEGREIGSVPLNGTISTSAQIIPEKVVETSVPLPTPKKRGRPAKKRTGK